MNINSVTKYTNSKLSTMKTFKLFLALLLTVSFSYSQRVDLDRFGFLVTYRELPAKPIGLDYKTYSVKTELGKYISSVFTYSNIVNQLQFGGFTNVLENGDLTFYFNCEDIAILRTEVKNRVEETKDKDGKITSRKTLYWFEIEYNLYAKYELLDNKKGGISIVSKVLDTRENKYVYKSSETESYQSAKDAFQLNRDNIIKNIVVEKVNGYFQEINSHLTSQYGYLEYTTQAILWVIGSKKHQEFEKFNEVATNVKNAFKKMNASDPIDAIKDELQPSIDYFKGIIERYNSSEKGDKKIRYAAYYNLATIYFYLDNMDECIKYANLLISNDYDTRDGKNLIKEAELQKTLFEKNNINTRHFPR